MLDLKTLLVPTDFSNPSRAAVDAAVALAAKTGGKIHLAHTVQLPVGVPHLKDARTELLRKLREAAEGNLRAAQEEVGSAGIAVDTHLAEGASAAAIAELAATVGASLIVMGTRGLAGVRHVLLGSVAERTVCLAPCPVMTIKEASQLAVRNILVPTDFSAHAERAVRCAIHFARLFGARIQLLRAYDAQILSVTPGAIATPTEFWEAVRNGAQLGLERARAPIEEAGVESELLLEPRDPTTAILETAEALRADLIVMGTRGLTGLRRALLGSTAGRTLRLAPCPVVTTSADED